MYTSKAAEHLMLAVPPGMAMNEQAWNMPGVWRAHRGLLLLP